MPSSPARNFHPSDIHGISPFRGMTSSRAGNLSADPALLFLGWTRCRAAPFEAEASRVQVGRLPVPLRTRRKGRLRQEFVRVRIDASATSLPRLRMKTVCGCGPLHGSFAGCRASQVALVGRRCPEGHRVPCPVRRMAGLSRRVAAFRISAVGCKPSGSRVLLTEFAGQTFLFPRFVSA